MLKITIDGPKIDSAEGEICTIDIRRVWDEKDGYSKIFQKSYMVKTNDYGEALKYAAAIVDKEELYQ